MRSAPLWFKWFPAEFRDATRSIEPLSRHFYRCLIDIAAMDRTCGVLNNEKAMRAELGTTGPNRHQWTTHVLPMLDQFWVLGADDHWRNKRLLATRFAMIIQAAGRGAKPLIPREPKRTEDVLIERCKALATQFLVAGWDGKDETVIDAYLSATANKPRTSRELAANKLQTSRELGAEKTLINHDPPPESFDNHSRHRDRDKDKNKQKASSEIDEGVWEGFEKWWLAKPERYPKDTDKAGAFKRYQLAIKAGMTHDDLMKAMLDYKSSVSHISGNERRGVKMATTLLNSLRENFVLEQSAPKPAPPTAEQSADAEAREWKSRVGSWRMGNRWKSEWGPPPLDPATECPHEILQHFAKAPITTRTIGEVHRQIVDHVQQKSLH